MTKTSVIRIRATPKQVEGYRKEAKKRGLTLSAHIISTLEAARTSAPKQSQR